MTWEFQFLHFMKDLHSPISDTIFSMITKLGDKGIVCIVLALCLILLIKDKRMGLTVCMAVLLEFLVCNILLKNIIARDRPFWTDETLLPIITAPKDFSFPSGHSSVWAAVAASIFYWNKKWGIAAIVTGLLVAFSRLYLTVHFPTDVCCGIIIGVLAAIISAKIVEQINKKYSLENRFGKF